MKHKLCAFCAKLKVNQFEPQNVLIILKPHSYGNVFVIILYTFLKCYKIVKAVLENIAL